MQTKQDKSIALDNYVGMNANWQDWLTPTIDCFTRSIVSKPKDVGTFYGLQYLPIEAFKFLSDRLKITRPVAKTFYSSGTTAKERSKVDFSIDGLELYEKQAWRSFEQVLKYVFGDSKHTGYSLIPLDESWADSSLAHMLKSFQKHIKILPFSDFSRDKKEAVWIFGTGFHFVDLYDRGVQIPLPSGSIVFETGGTKGRTRNVSRQELYDCIGTIFSINHNQIISEYGMSELACQAYDFVTPNSKSILTLEERYFQFPNWIDVSVVDARGVKQVSGQGALCVYDPLRIDCTFPIRTQDHVSLHGDGKFQLQGRIQQASLKGCSLRAETLLSNQTNSITDGHFESKTKTISISKIKENCTIALDILLNTLNDSKFKDLITEYFEDQAIFTRWMLEDLFSQVPRDPDELTQKIVKSNQHENYLDNWLVIGPSTHPFAILPIIFYAYILDIQLTLRLSKTVRRSSLILPIALQKAKQKLDFCRPIFD